MTVHVRPGETLEAAIARFKSGCYRAGISRDVNNHKAFSSKHEQQRAKWRRADAKRREAQKKAAARPVNERRGK